MAITATGGSSKPREIIPSGNYIARCYQMIHIGTYEDEYMGEPKVYNKVRLTWELPTELRVFNEENGEHPMVIDKEYTISLYEKANLCIDLESWRGKAFTEKEKEGFDLTNLVDKWCMLNVIHKQTKKGNTYAKVASIAVIPKGLTMPEAHNPTRIFDYENNFDIDFLNSLPSFIKDNMLKSNEYKDCTNQIEGAESEKHMQSIANEADDLPF